MIGMVLAFLFMFGVFFFGIKAIKETNKTGKWKLTKMTGYIILCAALSVGALTLIAQTF